MSNKAKDTALHEAVKNHYPIAVQLLTQEDPEFCHPANNAETPLYLVVERGYVRLVFVILETCTIPAYGGPGGRIALHSAIIHNLEGCTRKLLQWKPALSKEADAYGWTPLHYVACFGWARIYFTLRLINQKDGNTSLHLLAASDCYEAGLVKHPKADMMAFNDASLTPLDVSQSVELWGFTKRNFTNAGANLRRRDVFSRDKDEMTTKERHHVLEKVLPADIRRSANTHFIVATLIATTTFAAGYTVPGGYDAGQGFDHGTAILARKAAFKAFVIMDFMAMIFSTTAMLIYFVVAGDSDRDKLLRRYASILSHCHCRGSNGACIHYRDVCDASTFIRPCNCLVCYRLPLFSC
ncbi:unnamed protein product [Camellia sinensis]